MDVNAAIAVSLVVFWVGGVVISIFAVATIIRFRKEQARLWQEYEAARDQLWAAWKTKGGNDV